ncbi:MAG TPA: CopD family protein [Gammaproteobacteria bacterium]|jgi:putative membrane protein
MLWLKALHLISMVTWFAGLFYLPRLFVYHAMTQDEAGIERFKIMERKLLWGIMTPGAVMTLGFGVWMLLLNPAYFLLHWMQIKLALIAVLVVYHLWCGKLVLNFKHNRNKHTHVWYRWFNEFPVIILIAVILLAVLKP